MTKYCECCGARLRHGSNVEVLTFTRHVLDKPAVLYPRGHAKYPEGRSMTSIEVIRESIAERGYWIGRRDIALVNITRKGNIDQQALEPHRDTMKLIMQPAWAFLSDQQRDWAHAEVRNLVQAEFDYDLPSGTLTFT